MKILSSTGFQEFQGIINQGIPDRLLKIVFSDNTYIRVTPDHRFLMDNMWIYANLLDTGDSLSNKKIISIEEDEPEEVFDMYEVENTHAYISNGVLSHNCNLLYIDELSSVPNTVAEEFFASTYPTISSGESSKIIITSTPIGFNHFYHMWHAAEAGTNGFVPKRVEYWEHPAHDEQWAQEQKELLGEVKYNQECLMHFIGSSYTLIPGDTLSKLTPSLPIINTDEGLVAFEKPKSNSIYVMTVDVSKGVGGDYSVIQIIDITALPYKQVARYRNNTIPPLLFPNIIYKLAKEYNNAYVLVEINASEQVAHILFHELEYENVIIITKSTKGLTKGQIVGGGFSSKSQLGVNTDKKVKRVGCSNLKSLIVENKLLINDAITIAELSTFIEHRDSFAADDGYHDDLVMGLVIFAWLTDQQYFKDMNNVNIRNMMYANQMMAIEEELTPFGFYDDGQTYDNEVSSF